MKNELKGLLDHLPDAIIITDKLGTVRAFNDNTLALLGYESERLIDRSLCQFLNKVSGTEIMDRLLSSLKDVAQIPVAHHELEIIRKDGKIVPVQTGIVPFISQGVPYVCFALRDISVFREQILRLKDENLQLKNTLSRSKENNERLRDFSDITAHNLRGPVSNLQLLLNLYNYESEPNKKEFLMEKFDKVVSGLNHTLDVLVESIQFKRSPEKNKALDLKEILERTQNLLIAQIESSDCIIESDFSKVRWVTYNQIYMESIFLNLIGNAIKYRSENRRLIIEIKSWKDKEHLMLSFKDNGLGIDLDKHRKDIFGLKKMFHDHPDAKGIGLFMTKTQIESQGGSIRVESEPGQGCCFIISLN